MRRSMRSTAVWMIATPNRSTASTAADAPLASTTYQY